MMILALAVLLAVDTDISKARERGHKQQFEWSQWSDETFARAKREKKFILLDCAAEWCHWCHVMDETTYADPDIGKILREKFVAIKVDIDERPDLAERYGAWGWPATVIFSAEAEELGKFRGYLSIDEFKPILALIGRASAAGNSVREPRLPVEALGWLGARVTMDMDEWYDAKEGGWGFRQKAPIGANVQFELRRAAHGDSNALQRAKLTLKKQSALIDPVWGGIYQYSAAGNWNEPHYEKLMTYEAANLEAYVLADMHDEARQIDDYIAEFLTATNGAFFTSQDADLNAHEKGKPFVDGHTYYALNDAGRRKLGIPRIDTNVYPRENGLAMAALFTLYDALDDRSVMDRACRAAEAITVAANGDVPRKKTGPLYLADAAAYGWGLARLGYRKKALLVGEATLRNFFDEETGACWEHTPDPNAVGVFARRQQPFVHNVMCARFFAALGWKDKAQRILAAVATPRNLDEQGRMVGEFLLALDEAGAYQW